jgi:hypothetical protein
MQQVGTRPRRVPADLCCLQMTDLVISAHNAIRPSAAGDLVPAEKSKSCRLVLFARVGGRHALIQADGAQGPTADLASLQMHLCHDDCGDGFAA